jgi:polar amino acid transport system substrate-binding protein
MSLVCKLFARPVSTLASIIAALYVLLALQTQLGASLGAASLDPVWAAVQQRGELRVATDIGFRPFADLQGDAVVGYDVDLARALGRQLGVRVTIVPTGFDALYDSLTSGQADLVASALPYNPEYGDRARFSEFYFNAGQVLVVPAASPAQSLADMRGGRVGVTLGSDADDLARRLLGADTGVALLSDYDEPQEVLAALTSGAIDGAIVDNIVALSATQRDPGLRAVQPALSLEPFVLAMPPRAFQLQAAVNSALRRLQEEGFMAELNRKWLK